MIKLRNWFWNYPEWLFFGRRSVVAFFGAIYRAGAPFTTAIVLIILTAGAFALILDNSETVLMVSNKTLVEGIVVGIDPDTNQLVQLSKISPLTSSSNKGRLEKDLIELLYEGLIHVGQNGEVKPVLASYGETEKGKKYRFKLKENIYWHDGTEITVDDVVATFELLKKLDANPATSTIYSKAAVQMNLNKIENDPKAFEFEVKGNTVIPGLFEALSFKILPAHLLGDVTPENVDLQDPIINRFPIGSGPYKFKSKTNDSLEVDLFDKYHGDKPTIETIKFKFFATEQMALEAIQTGQIHTLVSHSVPILSELQGYDNLDIAKTNVFYNQYYAMYFNFGENANSILKDIKVRQAIAYAINKQAIVDDVLKGYGLPADGPIPPISFAYTDQYNRVFDTAKAMELLDSAGWKLEPGFTFRTKEGVKLVFKLFVLDNQERLELADKIKTQLAVVGIEVDVEAFNSSNLRDILTIHNFDAILYGTQTFIDPDRYELFHSSQITAPGLNFSSWASSETTGKIIEHKAQQIPQSDDDLETARRIVDVEVRTKFYKDFQRLVSTEVPVIFLYYPADAYIYNKRLSNVTLTNLNSINQRFIDIKDWRLN